MTFIHLVILSVYARHGLCTSNISQMTYCCNYQKKGESHEEGKAKSRKMLIAEFLRRSENSNELPGKNGQIKGRETISMTDHPHEVMP